MLLPAGWHETWHAGWDACGLRGGLPMAMPSWLTGGWCRTMARHLLSPSQDTSSSKSLTEPPAWGRFCGGSCPLTRGAVRHYHWLSLEALQKVQVCTKAVVPCSSLTASAKPMHPASHPICPTFPGLPRMGSTAAESAREAIYRRAAQDG